MSLKDYESNINPSRTLSPPSWEVHPLKVTAPTMMVMFIEGYWRLINHPVRGWWKILKTQPANTKLRLHWVARQPHGHVRRSQRPGVRLGTCRRMLAGGIQVEPQWAGKNLILNKGHFWESYSYTYYNHHSSDITVRSVYFLPDMWLWRKVHQWFNEPSKLAKFGV
jgi:hypothetical protein